MYVAPRALLLSLALLAVTFTPTATADECVEVVTSYFGEGLRVIASASRTVALGLVSGQPGDGIRTVVVVSPALCGGIGFGLGAATHDPVGWLEKAPKHLPLP